MSQVEPQALFRLLERLLLTPERTLAVASAFRPVLPHLVTHLLGPDGPAETAAGPGEPWASSGHVLRALAALLPVAPHLHR